MVQEMIDMSEYVVGKLKDSSPSISTAIEMTEELPCNALLKGLYRKKLIDAIVEAYRSGVLQERTRADQATNAFREKTGR